MLLDLAQQGVDALERLGAPPFLAGEGFMQPAVFFFQPGRFHALSGKLGAQVRILGPQTVQPGQEFGDTRLKLFQKFHGFDTSTGTPVLQGASPAGRILRKARAEGLPAGLAQVGVNLI